MSSSSPSPAASLSPPLPSAYDPSAPVQHELHLPKEAEEWLQTLSPGTFKNYQDIQGTWNHPITQFSITLVNDPLFTGALSEMAGAHAGGRWVGYEAILIIFIWILRAWRLSKASTFLTRMRAQAWVGFLFWVLSIAVIPFLVWGSAYQTAVNELIKAVIRHFFV
jgi:hypothetical protein